MWHVACGMWHVACVLCTVYCVQCTAYCVLCPGCGSSCHPHVPQLLAAKSEALCLRVASGLGAQLDGYEAPPEGSTHADALPALVRRVLAAYDEQAGGAAKGEGRRQLLDTKAPPPATIRSRSCSRMHAEAAAMCSRGRNHMQ